jgi:hypothetical protein
MQAKGAGELEYRWTASGLAVIKEVAPGKLLLKRAQNSGTLNVKLVLSNGGEAVSSTATVAVKEPQKDTWVQRTPDKDEKPVNNQFYARDDKNEGALYYSGTLNEAADAVFLKVYADDKLVGTQTQKPGADRTYAFTVKLKLAATESARAITYLVDRKWDIKNLLYGENGIAALTFCDVPISTDKLSP